MRVAFWEKHSATGAPRLGCKLLELGHYDAMIGKPRENSCKHVMLVVPDYARDMSHVRAVWNIGVHDGQGGAVVVHVGKHQPLRSSIASDAVSYTHLTLPTILLV